jgi:transposase InsO family protein
VLRGPLEPGQQYTSIRFTQRLLDAGIAPSTGGVGDSFDNALAENLWSTIKIELIHWPATTFATKADAQAALFRHIGGWFGQPTPHPSRARGTLARPIRGFLARQAPPPQSGYPPTGDRRSQIEESPGKRGNSKSA